MKGPGFNLNQCFCFSLIFLTTLITRKHSSRMHTTRLLSVQGWDCVQVGGVCSGVEGCVQGWGMCVQVCVCPGVCVSRRCVWPRVYVCLAGCYKGICLWTQAGVCIKGLCVQGEGVHPSLIQKHTSEPRDKSPWTQRQTPPCGQTDTCENMRTTRLLSVKGWVCVQVVGVCSGVGDVCPGVCVCVQVCVCPDVCV